MLSRLVDKLDIIFYTSSAALSASLPVLTQEDALQWLVDARLVHKVYQSSAPRLPIAAEVKSKDNTTSRSLKKFKELFPDQVKLRVRFSLDNLKLDDDLLNIPLFMADYTDQLIGFALEQKKTSISL